MTMQHKYYLFDFDGTLVDSMPTFCSCMLRILDEHHISYPDDITKTITPLGLNGTAEYFINILGLDIEKNQLMNLMKEYMLDAYFYKIPAKVNVISVLKALKAQGASLNVLTASPHITLDACLKRLEMWELFDNVWSCDDFETTKANPQIYVMAAQKMNTPVENVLFLDDNIHADLTAKSAGMQVCGVYDESSKDCVAQMKAANDFYIYNFQELLHLDTNKKA
jgi:HAD superfamily hydrolase (TIGR01509 family)